MKNQLPAPIICKLTRLLTAALCFVLLLPVAGNAQCASNAIRNALEKDSVGDYIGEIKVLNRVIHEQPNIAQAWYLRGKAKYQLADYHGAIADEQQAAQLQPGNEQVYLANSYARLALKQYRAAAQDLSAAIAINPNNTATWYHRGFVWQQLGLVKKAKLDFSRANELGLPSSKDKLTGVEPE